MNNNLKLFSYSFLLSFMFFTCMVNGQTLDWVKQYAGNNMESEGSSIKVDASGNIYITGSFGGTVDFDPGPGNTSLTSVGPTDIFVSKMDATGNLIWVKQFAGATSLKKGTSISIDGSGNVYTTGYFQGTVDFDPGAGNVDLTSQGNNDIFVSKLDPSGNYVWAISLGGTNDDQGLSIDLSNSGDIYLTGYFSGTVDFDAGTATSNQTSSGGLDIFILKLNSLGNFSWVKKVGGTGYDGGFGLTLDASSNAYITGEFFGTVDFDPGAGTTNLVSAGFYDSFILKLDAAGNFVWAKQMGGDLAERGYSIVLDASGNIYSTGYFQGTADFDPGSGTANLTSAGITDIFISKLDVSGNLIWAKQLGGNDDDQGLSIAVDGSGNVYTTGYFRSTADFDPGLNNFNLTANWSDIFISKLDQSGNFVWAKNLGDADGDWGRAICVDGSGSIYTTGFFWGTIDFDPGPGTENLVAPNSYDVFILKLNDVVINPILTVSSSLNPFAQILGAPSAEQTFTVAGSDLTDNIIVSAPTNYEVSLTSGSGFASSVQVNQTSGTVPATTIYVRLNAGAVGAHNGDITITSGVLSETVAVTGNTTQGTTGFNENNHNQLSIFPNPGSGVITLAVSQPTSAVFTGANGAVLANLYLNGETSIDVSSYAPGVYFIRTEEGQTVKFIKE